MMLRAPAARAAALALSTRTLASPAATYVTQRERKPAFARAPPRERKPATDRRSEDSYELAERVKQFVAQDQLGEAVTLVHLAPLANVVVWNTLIHEILQQRKYKLAWETWMDMKRRGIEPSSRSYATFFSGFAHGARERQLGATGSGAADRVKAVYAQWLKYAETKVGSKTGRNGKLTIRPEPGEHDVEEISAIPTNAYISYLACAKNYKALLETFYAMPTEGVLAPNEWTYTHVLNALRGAIRPASAFGSTPSPFNREMYDATMDVWKRMDAEAVSISTQNVSLVIQTCREAERVDDQLVGLAIAERFFGLVLDKEDKYKLEMKTLPKPKAALDTAAFSGLLTLALELKKFNLVERLFNQVRDHPNRFGFDVLDYHHCDILIVALGQKKDALAVEELLQWMLRSSKAALTPRMSTWTNAMQAYWRDADLARAYRLLELLTGNPYAPVSDTVDPLAPPPPTPSPSPSTSSRIRPTYPLRYPTPVRPQNLPPRLVCTFLQTALATRSRGKIVHALSTITALSFGPSYLSIALSTPVPKRDIPPKSVLAALNARRDHKSLESFWRWRLADTVQNAIDRVLTGPEAATGSAEQRRQWEEWASLAERWKDERGDQKKGVDLNTVESMEGRRLKVQAKLDQTDSGRSRDARRRLHYERGEIYKQQASVDDRGNDEKERRQVAASGSGVLNTENGETIEDSSRIDDPGGIRMTATGTTNQKGRSRATALGRTVHGLALSTRGLEKRLDQPGALDALHQTRRTVTDGIAKK